MSNNSKFTFTREKILPGFDGKQCKVYPSLVKTEKNFFITYQMLDLSGSDVFHDQYVLKSNDGGITFQQCEKLQKFETNKNGIRTIFSLTTDYYSQYHKKWFHFGRTTNYENDEHPILINGLAPGEAQYIFRDVETGQYIGSPTSLPLPFDYINATPHSQVIEFENGDFLLTFYIATEDENKAKSLSVRYRYEDDKLSIVKAGTPLSYQQAARGLDEPSMAELDNKYYVTLRTDEQGLLAVSDNGFDFAEPMPWKWDDGSILENYNTMQRWIRYKDALYLAYTRKGANNDHVFRHRAPIFMARFDEKNLCLVKETEVILVPELGARLGNFTVTDISDNEFWLLTAEWMQPIGCEKYGSDNSIWIAKIKFEDN